MNRLYVANGGDGALRIFDGKSFAPVATVNSTTDADNMRYDAVTSGCMSATAGAGSGAIRCHDQ